MSEKKPFHQVNEFDFLAYKSLMKNEPKTYDSATEFKKKTGRGWTVWDVTKKTNTFAEYQEAMKARGAAYRSKKAKQPSQPKPPKSVRPSKDEQQDLFATINAELASEMLLAVVDLSKAVRELTRSMYVIHQDIKKMAAIEVEIKDHLDKDDQIEPEKEPVENE